jgi:hypothetical protein
MATVELRFTYSTFVVPLKLIDKGIESLPPFWLVVAQAFVKEPGQILLSPLRMARTRPVQGRAHSRRDLRQAFGIGTPVWPTQLEHGPWTTAGTVVLMLHVLSTWKDARH